jgi:single-strand DNA-binding protein
MRNINKVILVGNVSHDPQMKETTGGQPVTTFGVATHRYFTTKAGENKAVTEFHNVVTFGGIAKRCAETLKKGKLVYIEGYLKTRSFDLGEGKRSFRTEIVAYNMIILSKREAASRGTEKKQESNISEEEPPAIEEILDDNNTF